MPTAAGWPCPSWLRCPAQADRAVGFDILAGQIKALGVRGGFRAYNGSGDPAERYADDAMQKLSVWRSRLGGTPGVTAHASHALLREGDTGLAVAALQKWLNATFPAYSHIDLGPQRYGPQTVAVIAEFQRRAGVTGPDADGRIVGPRTWAALEHYGYR